MKLPYESDLIDEEWAVVAPFLAPAKIARPRIYSEREILNAIFYVLRSGCQWRLLPHDFPSWRSVYYHFKRWERLGAFDQMLKALLPLTRKKGGLLKSLVQCLSTLDQLNQRKAVSGSASMEIRKSAAESSNSLRIPRAI
jgi:putative transposase